MKFEKLKEDSYGLRRSSLDLPMETRNSDTCEGCPICWDPVEQGEELAVLACSHLFHSECINRWSRIGNSCPLCRRRLSRIQPDGSNGYCDDGEVSDTDEVILVGDGSATRLRRHDT